MVDNYLFTHCIYDISECNIKILDSKNVENDILRATLGHVVDELQPMLVRCYGSHLLMDNFVFTHCIYDISEC